MIKSTRLDGQRLYNLNETGLTTVQMAPKVVSTKGVKQVGQITSHGRDELETLCAVVSATRSTIPPAHIFSKKEFSGYLLDRCTTGPARIGCGFRLDEYSAFFSRVMDRII